MTLVVQDFINKAFLTTKNLPYSESFNPSIFWEFFLAHSGQEFWVSRLAFLDEDDPQVQRFHFDDRRNLLQAASLLRHKLLQFIDFSKSWSNRQPGLQDTPGPEELLYHKIYKIVVENYQDRQNLRYRKQIEEKIDSILDFVVRGNRNPQESKDEILKKLKSSEFQNEIQKIKKSYHNLKYGVHGIQSFLFQWVRVTRSLSQPITGLCGADITTPLSLIVAIMIDDPDLFTQVLVLDNVSGKPLYDGWDYCINDCICLFFILFFGYHEPFSLFFIFVG